MFGEIGIIAGIASFILLIIWLFVIPMRLLKLIDSQKETNRLLTNFSHTIYHSETLKGISKGYLKIRKCHSCNNVHAPEILKHGQNCPNCGFSYKKGNVIYKKDNKVESVKKDIFDKFRDNPEYEILLEL